METGKSHASSFATILFMFIPLNVKNYLDTEAFVSDKDESRTVCLVLQVFEEEHHILYLDHGGVIVAIKDTSIPLKILK